MASDSQESKTVVASPDKPWIVAAVFLLSALIAWLGYIRYAPPAVRPDTQTDKEFSVHAALPILESLVGDGIPHPAGSKQNKVVRQRILDFFDQYNIEYELQETTNVYWRTGETVPLVNIIARLPGTDPTGTIALASHYDSVPSGPGACDDGIGTAVVLEIARTLKQAAPPKNNFIFLITDGEEFGLLGAEKFVDEHPAAREIDIAINIEARGTSGPSLMFETGTASLWSASAFSQVADKPFTSSLFYEIYKLLPNDTDFTRFKELDVQGFNFGIIGDVKNYHTPNDSFAVADRGSFQHHGDNVYRLTKLLANQQLAQDSNSATGQRAVYFDVFGWKIFYWPESISIFLAVIPTVVFAFFWVGWLRRPQRRNWRPIIANWLGFLLVGAAMGLLIPLMNLAGSFETAWPDQPLPIAFTFWSLGISVAGLMAGWIKDDEDSPGWVANLMVWGLLAILSSLFAAGASYLFIIPLLVGCVSTQFRLASPTMSRLLSWVAIAIMWLPIEFLFYDALGYRLNIVTALRVTIVCGSLVPVLSLAGRKAAITTAIAALVVFVICVLLSAVL